MKAKFTVLMIVFCAMAFPFHFCAASNVTVSGGITGEVRYTPENGWHGGTCMQLQGFVSSEGANMQYGLIWHGNTAGNPFFGADKYQNLNLVNQGITLITSGEMWHGGPSADLQMGNIAAAYHPYALKISKNTWEPNALRGAALQGLKIGNKLVVDSFAAWHSTVNQRGYGAQARIVSSTLPIWVMAIGYADVDSPADNELTIGARFNVYPNNNTDISGVVFQYAKDNGATTVVAADITVDTRLNKKTDVTGALKYFPAEYTPKYRDVNTLSNSMLDKAAVSAAASQKFGAYKITLGASREQVLSSKAYTDTLSAKVDTTVKATRLSLELRDVGKSNHPRSYTDATLIASRTINLGVIESAKLDVEVNADDSFGLYCKADTKLSFAIPVDALKGAKAYVGATTGTNISDKKADESTIYMGMDYTNPMGVQIKVRYRTPNAIGDNYGQEDNLISFSRQWFF